MPARAITPPFLELVEARSWRDALEILDAAGWELLATGDWSWVHGSPGGEYALRTTPFDPAFREFIGLCRELPGNRHLPTIHGVFRYRDHSYSTVMERLLPCPRETARRFLSRWVADPLLSDSRVLYDALHGHRSKLPLFAGPDVFAGNLMVRSDGTPVVIDGFWIRGRELHDIITSDPAAAVGMYPEEALRRFAALPVMTEVDAKALRAALDELTPVQQQPAG